MCFLVSCVCYLLFLLTVCACVLVCLGCVFLCSCVCVLFCCVTVPNGEADDGHAGAFHDPASHRQQNVQGTSVKSTVAAKMYKAGPLGALQCVCVLHIIVCVRWCVLHVKALLLPIGIWHIQCPCRFFILERHKLCRSLHSMNVGKTHTEAM